MTCSCDTICRLPGRCERMTPAYVPPPVVFEPLELWQEKMAACIERVEWVMPESAKELRQLLRNVPQGERSML